MGKMVIILIVGLTIIVGIISASITGRTSDASKTSAAGFTKTYAKDIASSAAEYYVLQLKTTPSLRGTFSIASVLGGSATVTIQQPNPSRDSLIIQSTGQYSGVSESVTAVWQSVQKTPTFRATFTAYSPSAATLSDMYVDGRNYRSNGVTIAAGSGTFAISSAQPSYVNNPKAYIGGTTYVTSPATDLNTTYPEDARSVETNAAWPTGYPNSPDKVLGFSEGTLKSMAQSGTPAGSQYVTDPHALTYPLRGITYIELPNGTKEEVDLKTNPSGILIVHNSAVDAEIDKLEVSADPFKGIIIVDKIIHIHTDVLGAMMLLAVNTSLGNCKGNKDHYIRYSTEVIQSSLQGVMSPTLPRCSPQITAWYE